jgi:hypothetical protein
MSESKGAARLERLRGLTATSDEQARYAARLLDTEGNVQVALAALEVLRARHPDELRPALLRGYEHRDAKGARRDQGGAVRAAILHALRPIASTEDVPLLERAVTTYEFLFGEATGDLRAAGLVVLNEVDGALAGYHAVRLLTDRHTDVMSGEPAVTAVRVLASQEQLLPLYAYVMREEAAVADVLAESLRSLTALPPSLLPTLLERYKASEDEIVLLGLFDLLLAREDRAEHTGLILQFLRDTSLLNIYRYLVSALVARREDGIIERLEELAGTEEDRYKSEILREALALR